MTARQPAESTMPFYRHVQAEERERARVTSRPAVRWVKVAWLGGLLSRKGPVRDAAKDALACVDNEDAMGLVAALRAVEAHAVTWPLKDLARGAAEAVERALRDGANPGR